MKNEITVLIVDDEQHIADLLDTNLKLDGYQTILCDNGRDALTTIRNQHVDIVLLDVMLPDTTGVEICRKIKHTRPDIAILMLSALGQSSDRIKGLKAGADDYLPKPFDLEELSLRMSKLVDRSKSNGFKKSQIKLGEASVDFATYTLTRGGNTHKLSSKEVLLLKFMNENRGQVLSRQLILDEVWGFDHYPNTRTIDNYISNFRKYIEVNPSDPKLILSIRGVGYLLAQ